MELQPDFKIYIGIVIQNNDPEMRGRAKIFIPILAPTITALNQNVDKFFAFIGEEANPQITQVLNDLKDILPWAEYAGPICGGNASGRYNAYLQKGTTSDSNAWVGEENSQNLVDGFRPVQNYIAQNAQEDAFTNTGLHKNKFVNQYAFQYTPTNYSGLARGLFSIPNVGSHVYVFFANGDRNFPVYFASAYSQDDIKRIFTLSQDVNDNNNVDYPASYENIKKDTLDSDSKTYRSKTVLNSNKHTIELIDTDLREIMKFTHYSGSFKEFNNYATIELATGNDQKLVLQDQFSTVKKNKSEYVGLHRELITGGDNYINIGEADQNIVKQILEIHKQFHVYKLLFDVQRAKYGEKGPYGNPNDMSPLQDRKGITVSTSMDNLDPFAIPPEPVFGFKEGFIVCPVCRGKRYNPYDPTYSATGNASELWFLPGEFNPQVLCQPDVSQEGDENLSEKERNEKALIQFPDCHKYEYPPTLEEELLNACTPIPHPFLGRIGYYAGMQCACCKGTGISPSTEAGSFELEPIKQPNGLLDKLILSKSPELFKLEKQLGPGGDEIKTITMNKIETIGLVMNDLKSFRVDPIGKLKIDGCWVAPQKTYDNFKPSPHVEYVDVQDIPGGDYILTCMNKYKLLVGARGVNIQTFGPIDIYGAIINFTGEQVNISSKNEVIIDGGERFSLRARKISLLPVEHNAVVVDGQLHVTRNTIIEGGIMLEGEVGLLHITAPFEYRLTENPIFEKEPDPLCTITVLIPGLYEGPMFIPKHTHKFKSIPFRPLRNREAVRETMIQLGINSRTSIAAALPTTNAFGCSESIWNNIASLFQPLAWTESKAQAESKGINTEQDWMEWNDAALAGEALYGAPMTNNIANGRICSNEGNPDGTITTTITATYYWSWQQQSGYVNITGKVNENGELIEGPSVS